LQKRPIILPIPLTEATPYSIISQIISLLNVIISQLLFLQYSLYSTGQNISILRVRFNEHPPSVFARSSTEIYSTDCNTLQYVASHCVAHCGTLQNMATTHQLYKKFGSDAFHWLQHTATHCITLRNALQHIAIHCNTLSHMTTHCNTCHTLQQIATRCNELQHVATRCNTLQLHVSFARSSAKMLNTNCHTLHHATSHCTTFCNTLQYIATHCNYTSVSQEIRQRCITPTATHCNTLRNTLQHSAKQCNTL